MSGPATPSSPPRPLPGRRGRLIGLLREHLLEHVEDRRRLPDTVRELLYARIVAPAVVGAGSFLVTAEMLEMARMGLNSSAGSDGYTSWSIGASVLVLMTLNPFALVIPTMVAKKGFLVPVVMSAAVFLSYPVAFAGIWLSGPVPMAGAFLGVIGAALGLAEGMLERSVATIYCGLLGGAFLGALVGVWIVTHMTAVMLSASVTLWDLRLLVIRVLACVAIHLGVGLSLAAGRRIRGMPSRKGIARG